MIFRLYIVYNKHEIVKKAMKLGKNSKSYRKCSNNFAADCSFELEIGRISIRGSSLNKNHHVH